MKNSISPGKIKKEEYLLLLQKQIEEKKHRDLEHIRIREEQGKIWHEQDINAKKEDYLKKIKKLHTQKTLHNEYSERVAEKNKKRQENVMLSPKEAEINRKVFESALAIIESNSPTSSYNN